MDAQLKTAISELVNDLVRQDYAKIDRDGRCGRLTASELRAAIADYGGTLTALPEDAWPLVALIPRKDQCDAFAVDVPLWTAEEGRSDLTLSLTAVREESGPLCIRIDDLHVL